MTSCHMQECFIVATRKLHYSSQQDALHNCPVCAKKEPERQTHQSHIEKFKHLDLGIKGFKNKKVKSYFNFCSQAHTVFCEFTTTGINLAEISKTQNAYIDSFHRLLSIFLHFFLLHQIFRFGTQIPWSSFWFLLNRRRAGKEGKEI